MYKHRGADVTSHIHVYFTTFLGVGHAGVVRDERNKVINCTVNILTTSSKSPIYIPGSLFCQNECGSAAYGYRSDALLGYVTFVFTNKIWLVVFTETSRENCILSRGYCMGLFGNTYIVSGYYIGTISGCSHGNPVESTN